jgi:CheY-like chemotaxis protein
MPRVVALVDDLIFRTKILETAKHAGVDVLAVSAPAVVDLNARTGGITALQRLREAGNQAPVVAFLSHVQTELAEQARAAGCTSVLPRSKFSQQLPEILRQAKGK